MFQYCGSQNQNAWNPSGAEIFTGEKKIAHRATILYPFLGFPTTEQHERQDEDSSSFTCPGVYGTDVWRLPSSYLTERKAAARQISVWMQTTYKLIRPAHSGEMLS